MVTTPTPWKGFTQVNTADDPVGAGFVNQQVSGNVVALSDGGYVVTWTDASGTHNPNLSAVVGQKYNVFGEKVGGEVDFGRFDDSNQAAPTAVLLADGSIAVAFNAANIALNDFDIYVNRFDANLNFLSTDGIDLTGPNANAEATVTPLATGGYIAAYEVGTAGSPTDLLARTVNADGSLGASFVIEDNTAIGNRATSAQSTTLADGNAVVVFQHSSGPTPTSESPSFRRQAYSSRQPPSPATT